MLALVRRLVTVLAALALAACDPPASHDPTAGIAEGTAGLYEISVVDLDSREPIAGATILLSPFLAADQMATTGANGLATFPREGMGIFSVEVSAPDHVPARWTGIVGGRVIIPVRAMTTRGPFEVTVTGLADDESAVVSLTTRPALFQPSAVRLTGVTGATLGTCESTAPGSCSASIRSELAPMGRIVLVAVTDEAGAARRLVRFDSVMGGTELDLATGADLALETVSGSVPTLPAGLNAVVGVPGISFGSAVGIIGFAGDRSVALPVVTGMLATRWALFVAAGETAGVPDPNRRSVLVDRRAETELGPWTEWLQPPSLVPSPATRVALLTGSEGATVHVIDWLDGDYSLRTDLVFDTDAPITWPEGADNVRVRAIDTTATNISLSLDDAERATTRFAELDREL